MDYQAVKHQHVLPKATIERYYSQKKHVYVMRKGDSNDAFPANANNSLFIANRQWDERAEKCVNDIETKFQILSEKIIKGDSLDAADFTMANVFYAILQGRSKARYHEFEETESLFDKNTVNYSEVSKSEQDYNERQGIFFLRSEDDNTFDRIARGQFILESIQKASTNTSKWGVFTTSKYFIVSDLYDSYAMIPVSPTIYLVKDRENIQLNESETNNFNSMIMEKSEKFIFSASKDTLISVK